ncbi:MAG: ATP-dependent zinc metalloprotease FtsH [Treponema sp.]|nr:ATP-dependent zinc metalloprotease FtsH [Treponema sp.]
MDNNILKRKKPSFAFIFFIVMFVALLFSMFITNKNTVATISYSDFLTFLENDNVKEIVIIDEKIINAKIIANGGVITPVTLDIPYADAELMKLLREKKVAIFGKTTKDGFLSVIINLLPMIMMVFVFFMLMRQNSVTNERGMQFGRSRAKLYDKNSKNISFNDVAGQVEAKRELEEIVDFLKNKNKYLDLGAKIPKGVLLVGNPGTGKTLLARAVAGEADVPFFHMSGSDFMEMFVGVGASRVRDLFSQARTAAPAIVFIDEIDAIGRSRGSGLGGGHDEREQTLNQLLVEMDGFESTSGIIILAATNRPDVLDKALLRPGRFDRQVHVVMPDVKERTEILKVHAKKIKMDEKVDLEKFARATPGMSGADLSSLINEAALFAARKDKNIVGDEEFEFARDKILMGVARESMVLPEKEREMTAVHEAGHTLMYYHLKNVSPLHKVSVIPRGRALGVTIGLPKEDSYSHTKEYLKDQLIILHGGYAAEKVIYNDTTTGTQNDIQRATEIARNMVCQWGMSDLGPVSFGQDDEPIFMGKEIARYKDYSEKTAEEIDFEIKKIIKFAQSKAEEILRKNIEQLKSLAKELLEKETMDDEEIRELLKIVPVSETVEVV